MVWQVGDLLQNGKYTIESLLGKGGFGQTYCARTRDGLVTLKHLNKPDDISADDFADRQAQFLNEAMRLAKCDHPHIVKVHPETFCQNGLNHIVMDYVEGDDLDNLVKSRNQLLPLNEAISYIKQIGSALEYIHKLKPILLHRDVTPRNIVVRAKGKQAILVDFGNAKEIRPDGTRSEKSRFTEGYSAIELYSDAGKGAYSDVYSLAATLYYLLTAIAPISAQKRVVEDLKPPQAINPAIPDRINQAILAGMELKPAYRVQTVTELLSRLGSDPKPNLFQSLFANKSSQPSLDIAADKQAEQERREQAEREAKTAADKLKQAEAKRQQIQQELQRAEDRRIQQERQESQRLAQIKAQKVEQERQEQVKNRELTINLGNGITLELVRVSAGRFQMGGNEQSDEQPIHEASSPYARFRGLLGGNEQSDEQPIHEVQLKEFLIGKYAVTNSQWQAVMKAKGSANCDKKFQGDLQPVVGVSWTESREFCQKLAQQSGRAVRLPTESEWEYACRAGTTTPFAFGKNITTDQVNYNGNYPYGDAPKGKYREVTVNVDSFKPNVWGIYQMHGNVWEWCADDWHDNYNGAPADSRIWIKDIKNYEAPETLKLLRGGSWNLHAIFCRSSFRTWYSARSQYYGIGFRVVFALSS